MINKTKGKVELYTPTEKLINSTAHLLSHFAFPKKNAIFEVDKKMAKTNTIETIAMALLVIGGLNWGLTALGYNIVAMLLGTIPLLEKAVYLLVGLSALYIAYTLMKK